MKRHLLSLLFIVCITLMLPLSVEAAVWNGGVDTAWYTSNPDATSFTITNAEELAGFEQLVNGGIYFDNKTITLDADIDLGGTEHTNIWTAIGSEVRPFRGVFDGANHKISGLYSSNPSQSYHGLFGHVSALATVKNVSVEGTVAGTYYVAGVVSQNYGTVENCHNYSTVSVNSGTLGGVVGDNKGLVINCSNSGNISGTGSSTVSGGVVGYNNTGSIRNSYNSGYISGNGDRNTVGGVTGYNNSNSYILNCYNTGEVSISGNFNVSPGGIAGRNQGGSITNSYYLTGKGAIKVAGYSGGTFNNVGTFSSATSQVAIDPHYAVNSNIPISNIADALNAGVVAYNASASSQQQAKIWNPTFVEDGGFPVFATNWSDFATAPTNNQITTASELAWLIKNGNNTNEYTLANDIDLSGHMWECIGNSTYPYIGTLDGAGNKITGLYLYAHTSDNQGLFGVITGTVKNVGVYGSVLGKNSVGGLVGYNGGNVTDSYTSATATGQNSVGGLVGDNDGNITNSYNNASVTGQNSVGGLVGDNDGNVADSYNNAAVTGQSSVGGLVGDNDGNITDSYNKANITISSAGGGVVGKNSSAGVVINSYNIGNIRSVSDGFVGGVVGHNLGIVANSYNSAQISFAYYANNTAVGGVVGQNENNATVTNSYNIGVIQGITSYDSVGGVVGYNSGNITYSHYLIGNNINKAVGNNNGNVIEVGWFDSATSDITLDADTQSSDADIPTTSLLAALNAGVTIYNTANPAAEKARGWMVITALNSGYPVYATYWKDNTNEPTGGTITTPEQLAWLINNHSTGTYTLAKDIDLSAHMWTPIGTNINAFKGIFDGGVYKITGLNINTPTSNFSGLFGYVDTDGKVSNVDVNGYIVGLNNVAGVAGFNYGTITNCSSNTTLTGNDVIGGVVGFNYGTITNCSSNTTLTGRDVIGGVVGNNSGTVTNCSSSVTLTGSTTIGGVVGNSTGTIANCSSNATLKGNETVGGVVGWNIEGTVTNCYCSSEFKLASGADILGGVAGKNQIGIITNSYYLKSGGMPSVGSNIDSTLTNVGSFDSATSSITLDSGISNPDNILHTNLLTTLNDGVSAYNTANPTVIQLNTWIPGFTADGNYPIFTTYWSDFAATTAPTDNEITTPEQLAWLANKVNAGEGAGEYTLGKDIDLSGRAWVPIGNNTNNFTGTFDGGEYKITGLYINASTSDYQGVFGYVGIAGTVQNVDVYGSVTGQNHIAGVVGYNKGTLFNCIGNASVIGNTAVGAVVGNNYGGSITYCIGNASVNSDGTAGGVAGFSRYGIIANSHNNGTVTSTGVTVGGVVGNNADNSIVVNSYNSGDVSATGLTPYVGGIAGQSVTNANVTNCYNIGNVSATNQEEGKIGGVVGNNSGAVTNSYYLADNGADNGVGTGAYKTINLGSFSAQSMAITIEGTTDNSIPTTSLFTALNVGASAYNATVTPTMKVAYMWELVAENVYPSLTTAKTLGDVTYDEKIDADDLKAIAGDGYNMETTPENPYDVNGDGEINFTDLALVRNSKIFGK